MKRTNNANNTDVYSTKIRENRRKVSASEDGGCHVEEGAYT